MVNYIDEARIHFLSKEDIDIPLYQRVIKLSEESGELSQAFLKYDGSKNVSKSAESNTPVKDVLEEACDCINVAMDIINKITLEDETLVDFTTELFQKKLDKWEAKQKKYKNNGAKVQFEEIVYEDNMMGDQLFGHPSIKEIEKNLNK
jgi:NTP pyrophosphatase (non-canonical NTP hydrolase)